MKQFLESVVLASRELLAGPITQKKLDALNDKRGFMLVLTAAIDLPMTTSTLLLDDVDVRTTIYNIRETALLLMINLEYGADAVYVIRGLEAIVENYDESSDLTVYHLFNLGLLGIHNKLKHFIKKNYEILTDGASLNLTCLLSELNGGDVDGDVISSSVAARIVKNTLPELKQLSMQREAA